MLRGQSTVRLVCEAACVDRQAFSDVFPHLVTATNVPRLVKISDVDWSGVDAAFCCLPHATTQEILASLPQEVREFSRAAHTHNLLLSLPASEDRLDRAKRALT